MRFLSIIIPTLFLSACSLFDVVNTLTPENGSTRQTGITYGDHPRQTLDIYRPESPGEHSAVIVFFYGGGWVNGERGDYEFVARQLAGMGHFVVIPDYRLYPEVVFPAFIEDGAAAVAYTLNNLTEIAEQSTPRPVFLMGHSAGGHMAAMIALDQEYLNRFNRSTKELSGMIGLAGAYDFLPLSSEQLKQIFPKSIREQSQPVNFVDPNDPPVLLLHGDEDSRVWPRNSINLDKKMKMAGIDTTLEIYPGINHAGILRPFIGFLRDKPGILEETAEFIRKQSEVM